MHNPLDRKRFDVLLRALFFLSDVGPKNLDSKNRYAPNQNH